MNLTEQLIRDEGCILHPYKDSVGKLTLGVGHNLDAKPITRAAALWILQDDINDATSDLITHLPWTLDLDAARFGVLVNLSFNLGIGGLLKFGNFLGHMAKQEWELAAKAGMDSLWAKQVGARADRLMKQVTTGEWV